MQRVAASVIRALFVLAAAISVTAPPAVASSDATAAKVEPISFKGEYYFYAFPETDEGSICAERHWFKDDGTEIVASGDEIAVYRFRVESDNAPLYPNAHLIKTFVSTNGKPDCLGNRNISRPGYEQRNGMYRSQSGDIVLLALTTTSTGMPVSQLVGRFVQSKDGMTPPSDPNAVIPPPPNLQNAKIMGSAFPGVYSRPVPLGAAHECESYYPPDAEDAQRGGVTLVAFKITGQGSVTGVKVVKTSGYADLDQAALACVKPWQYSPVVVDGKAVAAQWLAKMTWRADIGGTPYEASMRALRRDAWNCLWSSAAAKSLPPQFDGVLQAQIRYSDSSTPAKIVVATSSGNEKLDTAALACLRQSSELADLEKNRGEAASGYIRLALWNSSGLVEPVSDNLFDATKAGDLAKVKALIAAGADVNAKDDSGETSALDWAARKNHIEIMELLIAHGADVRARDFYGFTPLHHAAAWGGKESVELLLAHGADVNDAKNRVGQSPLHYAISPGREDVIALLIDHGADINAKDVNLETPLHLAVKLAENGMMGSSEPSDNGDTKTVAFLLAHGADINAKDKRNNTPLHHAAWGGHKGVVELLLAHGADVNVKNNGGETPLKNARKMRHDDIAELLRQHGASD
jgi:TonB family protein